jgi:hypothetical protein
MEAILSLVERHTGVSKPLRLSGRALERALWAKFRDAELGSGSQASLTLNITGGGC